MSREEGSVTVLTLMSMLVLVLAMIIALEFACVYAQKSVYDNDLNIAREETFSAGFSMQLKNSEDPGALICNSIVRSLRSNGYTGAVTFWFYECTEQEIEKSSPLIDSATNVRCIAYQVQLEDFYKTVMAPSAWLADLAISNQTYAALCPYALYRTYRPDNGRDGALWQYQSPPGNSTVTPDAVRYDKTEMTTGLQQAVQEALAKAEQIATTDQE